MANHNQKVDSTQKKQNTPQPPHKKATARVENHVAQAELFRALTENQGEAFIQGFVTHLSDARFPAVQRQAVAAQISKVGGNPYLRKVMSQIKVKELDSAKRDNQQTGQLHDATLLNRHPSVIARDNGDNGPPHITIEPFGNLTTYAQLAAAARIGISQVQSDLRSVPAGHTVHTRAAQWIAGLRAWLPYLQRQGGASLTAAAAAQARLHLEEGIAIRTVITNVQRSQVQREMNRVAAKARAAARKTAQIRPHLNDCLRAAYRSGDTSAIGSVSGTLGSMLDIGLGFQALARDSAATLASFRGVDLPAVGRYVTALERLNRGLALFNLAFSLTQTEATTQLEEGVRQLTTVAGAFSSLATLAGLPAHMGLYANLYLVPMTTAIMAGISRLSSLLQQENDIWAAVFGAPLRYGVEPGGRPMWQFMVSVMQAGSAAQVPAISSGIAGYLLEHRSALEAGSGEEAPTSGWWFWRSLQSARAQQWIFDNRTRVWGMFYGSRAVPN